MTLSRIILGMVALLSAWLAFLVGLITLVVSGKARRQYRTPLLAAIVVSFGVAVYFSARATTEKPASTPANVTQETHGEQSPAVQGVTGNVTITNNEPSAGKTK